jgi:hypothetical protein
MLKKVGRFAAKTALSAVPGGQLLAPAVDALTRGSSRSSRRLPAQVVNNAMLAHITRPQPAPLRHAKPTIERIIAELRSLT